jgi:hypothetical protein
MLLFWSVWFSMIFSSNLADGLRALGLLPVEWRFTSGNFGLILESIRIYSLGEVWGVVLFAGVVIVQLGTALLFWRASLARDSLTGADSPRVVHAFSAGVGLFALFLVVDELFVVYERIPGLATTHLLVLCGLLLSFLVLHVTSASRPGIR